MMNEAKMGQLLTLYFVMGSPNCSTDPEKILVEAIRGGITLFQFREKGEGALTDNEKMYLGQKLRKICRQYEIPFIVNDDLELALSIEADGIHVGQEDLAAAEVRKRTDNLILGVSAHNYKEAVQAVKDGADYLGVGPMYETKTKPDTEEVKGPVLIQGLRDQGIKAPIVGIGGITIENFHHVIRAGADGVAVITAISQATSPYEAAKKISHGVRMK